MSFSAKEIGIVCDSLRGAVLNTLVRKVISPKVGGRVCLELRGPGVNHYLQICVQNPFCSIGRVAQKPRAAEVPVGFAMLLRKMCINCVISNIAQQNDDRVIAITLKRKESSLVLMCELSGRHGNLFLLDENGAILGSYYPNRSHKRKLVSGEPYLAPANPPSVEAQRSRVAAGDDADAALMTLYAQKEKEAIVAAQRATANRAVKALLKKQRALVANLQKDQQNAIQATALQANAYILQANLKKVRRGDTQFAGVDFEGNPVTFALNPQLDAVSNMQAMFEKASRLGKATNQIEERLLNAMMDEERLVALQQEVSDAPVEKLDTLLAQLSQMNLGVVQRAQRRHQPSARLPYRQYPIFGAHTARVGKSAKDNDTLTLRHAKPNDLWLHVRGMPGSHVVVPLGRGEDPSQDVLVDAAHLAAHFSAAKNDDHVEVSWTRRKYVQKPKGAAAGSVRLLQEKMFVLKVNPERLTALLSSQT